MRKEQKVTPIKAAQHGGGGVGGRIAGEETLDRLENKFDSPGEFKCH